MVGLLARGLTADGHDVVMAAHEESDIPGVEVLAAPAVPAGVTIGERSVELAHCVWGYRQLVAARPDVIHDHTKVLTLTGIMHAHRAGIPVVITSHGPFDEHTRMMLADAAATGCAIVGISTSQAAEAGAVPVEAVIHHGIDVDDIPVGDERGGYLAFLGRFNACKGAARAARIARRAGVPLRIAAKMWEPEEVDYFRREIEPWLGGGVEYVGELGGREKYDLLGGATALLNPIDWSEPFGLTMVESLACGTPVIATPRGSVPELVEHGRTGLLASSDDELVAALGRCAELDRATCRRVAEDRFSVARMAAEHADLYRQLIANGVVDERRLTASAAAS
jgi:glycosyltransferase involved in cell wall biosynthesis